MLGGPLASFARRGRGWLDVGDRASKPIIRHGAQRRRRHSSLAAAALAAPVGATAPPGGPERAPTPESPMESSAYHESTVRCCVDAEYPQPMSPSFPAKRTNHLRRSKGVWPHFCKTGPMRASWSSPTMPHAPQPLGFCPQSVGRSVPPGVVRSRPNGRIPHGRSGGGSRWVSSRL